MNKNISKSTLLALLLFITSGSALFAQQDQYHFDLIDGRNGLWGNQINSIYKDEKGFMWFGTALGLYRYDGYKFKVFSHKPGDTTSVSDDYINVVTAGPHQTLCVLTRTGWNIYDIRTEKFTIHTEAFLHTTDASGARPASILKDKRNNFWYVFPGTGIFRYDPAQNKTILYNTSNTQLKLFSNNITSLAEDQLGNMWIMYKEGMIEKLDVSKNKIIYQSNTLQQRLHNQDADFELFADADDDLWIYCSGIEKGVFFFRPAVNQLRAINKNSAGARLNSNLISGIAQDDNGNIWVATDHGGINLINKKNLSIHYLVNDELDSKSLSQNSLNSIYKDNDGIMWLGTFKKGVNYFRKSSLNFPLYQHKPGNGASLMYNDINSFAEDKKGNLWIGTNGGGLIYYNRASGTYKQYLNNPLDANSLTNNVLVSLFIDKDEKLWIGTYFGGLDCFDGKKFIHYKHDEKNPNSLADDRIWEIFEDSRNRFWVGTFQQGLELFDRQKNTFIHHKPGGGNTTRSGYISSLVEDKNGNLWIGTAWGIDVLNSETGRFRHFQHLENDKTTISHSNISTILRDSRGLIWVGTKDGLNLYDPIKQQFKVYRKQDGLPDNTILTLLEDSNHTLWMSTLNGLSNFSVTAAGNNQYSLQFKNYDETDGLQGRQFNENAAIRTNAGELVFGGPNGFNMFEPSKIRQNKTVPLLALTDLQIFNTTVNIGQEYNHRVILPQSITNAKEITLKYNQNVFTIEFAALNFLNPEKTKYAYRLDGFSSKWLTTDSKDRKATFTNLGPGQYKLLIKAQNDEGSWSKTPLSLSIKILPPFWLTPFAFFTYVLLLVSSLLFARSRIIHRARLKFAIEQEVQEAKRLYQHEKQEAQRLHELDMMKMKFFTNVSHEFRTPLSLIITPIEKLIRQPVQLNNKKQFELIHRNARRLLNLVNQLLDFRKLEEQELQLNKTSGEIINFIKEISYSFSDIAENKSIVFSFNSSQSSVYANFDHDKLERILFNLLSNAFKFTPVGGVVNVLAEVTNKNGEETLQLKVIDTGIGISKENQEQIFERFFQNDIPGSIVNQGSGIGLAITKEFVKLHGGTIEVESEPDKGSCFIVSLPIQLDTEQACGSDNCKELSQGVSDIPDVTNRKSALKAVKSIRNRRSTILLIEDNYDFRSYIRDNLKEYYKIAEAENGKVGWQKTLTDHPDLIICDISMPEMNGIELCKKIKADNRTSFVPVILLTALTAEEQHLEGLQTGANDYMTKPFNFEILLSKIENLLSQQEKFKKTYQKQVDVKVSELVGESVDEKFMKRVLSVIEKNISNPDFGVEEMSREMLLSRAALYRKLFSLSGKTPIEFIRTVRLRRAAQLLAKNEMTVAEVAYEVGFNNPKYFAKNFKSEYNMLPSLYKGENNEE